MNLENQEREGGDWHLLPGDGEEASAVDPDEEPPAEDPDGDGEEEEEEAQADEDEEPVNFQERERDGERRRRQSLVDQFLAEVRSGRCSVEVLTSLVREYGGDGDLLWAPETQRIHVPVFHTCLSTLASDTTAAFLHLLHSEYPGVLSKQAGSYSYHGKGTLLHLAVFRLERVPLEVIRLLVNLNPEAVLIQNQKGELPIHWACAEEVYDETGELIPFDLHVDHLQVLVDAHHVALETSDSDGELPLHLLCWHLKNGGPRLLEAAKWMIEAHPDALVACTKYGDTPLMSAITGHDFVGGITPQVFHFLLELIERAPGSVWGECNDDGRTITTSALVAACRFGSIMDLVSMLLEVQPDAVKVRYYGRLPLHYAVEGIYREDPDTYRAIQLLIDVYPGSLAVRCRSGLTPIMWALDGENHDGVVETPLRLEFLLGMIRRGGSKSVWGTRTDEDGTTVILTALAIACSDMPNFEVISALIEECPAAALHVSLTEVLTNVPDEVRELVVGEAKAVFLALAELLLHDTTQGVVPDLTREHVRRAVGQLGALDNDEPRVVAQIIRSHFHWDVLLRFRSDVLDFAPLQDSLRHDLVHNDGVFLEFVSGVYRMNQTGA
jgi:ankyrin repeat protein